MSITQERARVASLTRSRPADDPELIEARRNLKAAKLQKYIQQQVDSWPPLTESQKDRLSVTLRAPAEGGGAA